MTIEKATFGAGCFWGVQHIFSKIEGVVKTRSGYLGGKLENPTYEDICSGMTGHAEVVEVDFDSTQTTYETLLDYFWRMHDPTTPNRQGVDIGTQYRSAIFYHNEDQKLKAIKSKENFDKSGVFPDASVTEITQTSTFYPAEEYHQDYYHKKFEKFGGEGPICHVLRER